MPKTKAKLRKPRLLIDRGDIAAFINFHDEVRLSASIEICNVEKARKLAAWLLKFAEWREHKDKNKESK